MNFHIMTLFPEMIEQGLSTSILGRAKEKGYIDFEAVNIRDYSADLKHRKVDDYTYGGGAGMLMQAQPIYDCFNAILDRIGKKESSCDGADENIGLGVKRPRVIYVTPQGAVFNQQMAADFAGEDDLIFLCGHYEGVDERVLEEIVTDYVSIGDYVLTGGELPAMVMIDAISRLVPGVLNNDESAMTESFNNSLLEYPQYSRPEEWMGKKVPAILLSGDHKKVDEWRLEQSIIRTRERRPDLYEKWLSENPPKPEKKKRRRKKSSTETESNTNTETKTYTEAKTDTETDSN
ncbi:MAG: tRNA (guanosine(37)-N1)-methyltransferase TrmD [Butyrivibrio sp.]|nr:tRNA (guanosine(37)-N1)-methyltransferase TrmD [Butyrivibrio sp.]